MLDLRPHSLFLRVFPIALLFLLSINCVSTAVIAGEKNSIQIFDASVNQAEENGTLLNGNQCREVDIRGETYLEIRKGTDPYSKVEWEFLFDPKQDCWNDRVVLEIRFFDGGAGVIQPRILLDGEHAGTEFLPIEKASFTRLNTRRIRSAIFEFDFSETDRENAKELHLLIAGVQHLRELKVHTTFGESDWIHARNSIPDKVEPMLQLERPLQLVTSAGLNNKGSVETLPEELELMDELAPLAKVLGFTAIESYVRWNWIEPEKEGEFDFQWVDAIVKRLQRHDLKWFPLLVVGSAYALPEWFKESDETVDFVCLEHGMSNPVQSIWSPYHKRHVTRFLQAFGKHYEPMGILEGVRLGPSGNYGESQYPAGGNWPAAGEGPMHIHIGTWAGDEYARADFRDIAIKKYQNLQTINEVWGTQFKDLSEIQPRLPLTIPNYRFRLDMTEWYTDSMTEWCDWWVEEAGKAMPNTKIYQSSGGWGFRESGTDYTAQTLSMVKVNGGIRLTNETDGFDQNFYATRLAATAARLYGVDLGYEPASSHTARGIVGRIFNTAVTNGDHLFTYYHNIMKHQLSIDKWLENLPALDNRQDPLIDVAIYYPETTNQLEDSTFRHLYAWGFNPRAREVRRHIEVDYLDERLIREGFLDRYKVLVQVWGTMIEEDVLSKIDEWVQKGGTLIYPSFPRGSLRTVEGDQTVFTEWVQGQTGEGAFHRYKGDMEPPSLYGDFVQETLQGIDHLHPWTKQVLTAKHSDRIFMSVQEDGHLMVINYSGRDGFLQPPGGPRLIIRPYDIQRVRLE